MDISNIGLSASSFSYTCGFTKDAARRNPNPFTLEKFLNLASEHGLGGVEVPLQRFIPSLNRDGLNVLKQSLQEKFLA